MVRNQDVSFEVTRERDGQEFIVKYSGKWNKDVIDGQAEIAAGDQTFAMDWKARRVEVTGTWQWSFTTPGGQTFEPRVRLRQEGDKLTGHYLRGEAETAISEGKIDGDRLSFKVNMEREGRTFTTTYDGKLEGDAILGKFTSNRSGQDRAFDWNAKRVKE
jgi:hypothetical protein